MSTLVNRRKDRKQAQAPNPNCPYCSLVISPLDLSATELFQTEVSLASCPGPDLHSGTEVAIEDRLLLETDPRFSISKPLPALQLLALSPLPPLHYTSEATPVGSRQILRTAKKQSQMIFD
ncbi:hypothetical protein llap_12424 [Limosa lapponica baueri]|uniref:Uncharacterized protein n=1 Tax=Limosa lapponica baueri TaxID=1758121 RepID=A0A2I0TU11_LIMLA|nr:hypothetical protein llap_12424 [Limosa lapponica baueri]